MQIPQNGLISTDSAQGTNLEVSNASASGKTGLRGSDQDSTSLPQPISEQRDTAAISGTATLLAQALAVPLRQSSQVQQITASLSVGTYHVDAGVLASTIMDSMIQTHVD